MDAVMEFLRRLPQEVRHAGGSLTGRAALLVLALVLNVGFYLPSLPAGLPGAGTPGADKLVHLLVFALTVWAAGRVLAPRARFPMGWVVLVAVVHALFIEAFQLLFLPARGAEGADLLVDALGIAIGVGLWFGERRRHQRLEEEWDEEEAAGEPVREDAAPPR